MSGLTPLALILIVVGGLVLIAGIVVLITVVAKATSRAVDRKNQQP